MVLIVHPVTEALRMHREPVKLAGKSNRKITDVNHFLDFPQPLLVGLPHFIRNQFA